MGKVNNMPTKAMKCFVLILFSILSLPLYAQKMHNVSGEFTYYAEDNETINQAKLKAMERAKLNALAKVFGTVLSQDTYSTDKVVEGKEHSTFTQLTSSEVKGEWIEDIKDPEFTINYMQNTLVVTCKVNGTAREISNESTVFEAIVLRNGTNKRYEDIHFKDKDDLYLYFRSPVDGYVAVYLVDETPTAYCLLPYLNNRTGIHKVNSGKEYVFFDANGLKTNTDIDELSLSSDKDLDNYKMYVLFSPNPFTKAVDTMTTENQPRQLSYDDFSKWLGKVRRREPKMGMKVIKFDVSK